MAGEALGRQRGRPHAIGRMASYWMRAKRPHPRFLACALRKTLFMAPNDIFHTNEIGQRIGRNPKRHIHSKPSVAFLLAFWWASVDSTRAFYADLVLSCHHARLSLQYALLTYQTEELL